MQLQVNPFTDSHLGADQWQIDGNTIHPVREIQINDILCFYITIDMLASCLYENMALEITLKTIVTLKIERE